METEVAPVTVSLIVSLTSQVPGDSKSKFARSDPVAVRVDPLCTWAKFQLYAYGQPIDSVTPQKVYVVSLESGNVVTGVVLEQVLLESRIRISEDNSVEIAVGRVSVVVPVAVDCTTHGVTVFPVSVKVRFKWLVTVRLLASVTISTTSYEPGASNRCSGFCVAEVVPSPKFHW